jgi:DNA-binding transcriptional ArsR family regulator
VQVFDRVCEDGRVHLVPADRRHRRILDDERVCQAIDALGDAAETDRWSERFALVGDPNRLRLLLCIHRAGPISVTDLATAVDMNDTAVSQVLRLLRASGTVTSRRDGRIVRYHLADDAVAALLDQVSPTGRISAGHHAHRGDRVSPAQGKRRRSPA